MGRADSAKHHNKIARESIKRMAESLDAEELRLGLMALL
jgi:hypothetical protein